MHGYYDKRQFPLNRFVLLYAVTYYYLRHTSAIQYSDFARRIRIVNNLIQNSVDEVSDRIDRNRIPAVLAQTEAIIATGKIDDSIENSFNINQLSEEKEKIAFLDAHSEQAETLFKLEDHPMLKGQISIVGIDNLSLADKFAELFTCNWDKIDCALMATGNYGQKEMDGGISTLQSLRRLHGTNCSTKVQTMMDLTIQRISLLSCYKEMQHSPMIYLMILLMVL